VSLIDDAMNGFFVRIERCATFPVASCPLAYRGVGDRRHAPHATMPIRSKVTPQGRFAPRQPMYLPEFLNLGAGFSKYFRALPALDEDLRRTVFRIRHAVYCEELGYEPVRDDRLESDEYDARSAHCLLQSVSSGEYVGCVRLVLANGPDPAQPLPFEGLCGDSIDRAIVDPAKLDRTRIAEVSRLAVIARYRRRRGEQKVPLGIDDSDFGTPDRPRFPYIAVGLYLGMLAQARRLGIDTLFMLTDRRLAKQLARLGVRLRAIGEPIAHRGTRYPSMMSVQEVIDGFSFFVRPLFAVIAGEINEAYQRGNGDSAP
jgi:N-acyl amino acid synthase of PEP-CTERM/exosortase system